MEKKPAKRLTPAEVEAREERLRAAGITVGRRDASVVTLLAKRTQVAHTPEDDNGME